MQHKIIKNKIYSTNIDDVELCLGIALNTAVLYTITGLSVYNYKIKKMNEIDTKLRQNRLRMEIRQTRNGCSHLIAFYKNNKIILTSEFVLY